MTDKYIVTMCPIIERDISIVINSENERNQPVAEAEGRVQIIQQIELPPIPMIIRRQPVRGRDMSHFIRHARAVEEEENQLRNALRERVDRLVRDVEATRSSHPPVELELQSISNIRTQSQSHENENHNIAAAELEPTARPRERMRFRDWFKYMLKNKSQLNILGLTVIFNGGIQFSTGIFNRHLWKERDNQIELAAEISSWFIAAIFGFILSAALITRYSKLFIYVRNIEIESIS